MIFSNEHWSLSGPTTLQDPDENNHVFNCPVSGELKVDIHVRGSPGPNRATLWRQSLASSKVPVSSRDFQWTYVTTAARSGVGCIELSVTGGLESGGISSYTLKVENGIIGEPEFKYMFTVNDLKRE